MVITDCDCGPLPGVWVITDLDCRPLPGVWVIGGYSSLRDGVGVGGSMPMPAGWFTVWSVSRVTVSEHGSPF